MPDLNRRRFVLGAIAGTSLLAAPSIARGAGDFRSVKLYAQRTGEWVKTVYWVEGEYIPDAMRAIDHLMRDWREDLEMPIATTTVDILSGMQRLLECDDPFVVVSGYRSPKTNAMLRRRSRRVARNSYHVKAMAADLKLESRSIRQISGAAKSLGAGGVGTYYRANFVHIDSGPVRDWRG